jgi:competence protein ComEA
MGGAVPNHLPPRVVRGVAPAQSKKKSPEEPIDLNSATAQDLLKLPGIGPTLSDRIVQTRQQRPFASVEELRRVKGIGAKTLEKLRPHVRIGPDRK